MRLLITAIILIFTFRPAFGQDGQKLDYPYLGISLTVPEGFQYQEGDGAIMMGNPAMQGALFLVSMHEYKSMEELEAVAEQPYTEEDGTYLQKKGELERIDDDALGGTFTGFAGGMPAEAYIIAKLNPFGSGITVIGVAANGMVGVDQLKEIALQINSGVEVRQREIGDIVQKWTDYLNNTQLIYRSNYSSPSYTDGGISAYSSSSETYDVCAAGYFTYYGSSNSSVGGSGVSGYSDSSSEGSGKWEIDVDADGKPLLVLNFHNGKQERWTLYYEGGYLYLDDYKHTVGRGAEYGPRCN
jgi:hypothetical protein